jgi:hypothetical protein
MTDKLPQPNLPPQVGRLLKPGLRFGQAVYSAAQMHEYADAYADSAVAAERKRCAKPSPQPCALTWAIQRLNSTPYAMTKDECVEMLRGLRSEIQALSGPNVRAKAALPQGE